VPVIVHCAFAASGPGDDVAAAIALERRATAVLIGATQGSEGMVVYTSGVGVLADASLLLPVRVPCRYALG
jgi:hypothetical protein